MQSELEELLALAESDDDLAYVESLVAEAEGAAGITTPEIVVDTGRWIVATLGEVADFLGVECQTVREWRTGRNAMPGDEGRWDLREIVQWRCNRLKANSVATKDPEIVELEKKELALDVAKKDLAHRNARGDLVERSAVKSEVAAILNRVRTDVESIPSELGPSIPAELRSELTHQMYQQIQLILRKMSQQRGAE